MPTIIATGFAPVLQAVQAQLIAVTTFPRERVNSAAWDETPEFQGDQDVILHVGNPTPVGADQDSKGRLATRCVRPIEVRPRTRLALDVGGYADIWLTDPALGHLQLEELIFNALEQFEPADASGNWLVTEPMRLIPSVRPVIPEVPPQTPREWGDSRLTFEVSYLLALSPTFI